MNSDSELFGFSRTQGRAQPEAELVSLQHDHNRSDRTVSRID